MPLHVAWRRCGVHDGSQLQLAKEAICLMKSDKVAVIEGGIIKSCKAAKAVAEKRPRKFRQEKTASGESFWLVLFRHIKSNGPIDRLALIEVFPERSLGVISTYLSMHKRAGNLSLQGGLYTALCEESAIRACPNRSQKKGA